MTYETEADFDYEFDRYLRECEEYAAQKELTLDYVLDEFCILGELRKV